MNVSPNQFERYDRNGIKKSYTFNSSGYKTPVTSEANEKHSQGMGGFKKSSHEEKGKSCPHCGGSGRAKPRPKAEQLEFPGMGGIRPRRPEDKDPSRHPKYKPKDVPDSLHKTQKRSDMEKHTATDYFNKRTTKPDYKKRPKGKDDDDKSGGATMPRKPKPSPQSPGEYRPIERKTDPDYARKLDRYRVQAR